MVVKFFYLLQFDFTFCILALTRPFTNQSVNSVKHDAPQSIALENLLYGTLHHKSSQILLLHHKDYRNIRNNKIQQDSNEPFERILG